MGTVTSHVRVRFESKHGWTVRVDGRASLVSTHGTQGDAERSGRLFAQRARAILSVYRFDGDLVRTDTYVPTPT